MNGSTLALEGELDAFSAPGLRKQLHSWIDGRDVDVLTIDLSRVSFLDSTILGLLVGALRRTRESGGELRLVFPRPPADRIFDFAGLEDVFPRA